MNNGIYHVRFLSGPQQFGEGLAVIKDGTVNGGDPGYTYAGSMSVSGTGAGAHLHIQQWNSAVKSVFGAIRAFDLTLSGSASTNAFSVQGHITGQPQRRIQIDGRYVAAAA